MGEPERIRSTSAADKLKGCTICALVLVSALLGSFYILTPLLPLLFLNHTLWRKVVDRLVGFWLMLPSGLLEFFYGMRFTVTGKKIEHNEPALIIMNHRTSLDWLFFWNALLRVDPWLLTSEKISLKGILKYLPGAGWAMGCNAFLFLDRSFENDSLRIETMIDYYANSGYSYQLLLFPEGTDKCEKATERSRIFSLDKGLVHYAHVLHPKTTGFAFIVKKMRDAGYIKNIYDVTVAYSDSIVQSEIDLLKLGACPKNVHFDIRKIDIGTIPTRKEELANWLVELWEKKEDRLADFYGENCIEQRHLQMEENAHLFDMTPGRRAIQISVVLFWLFLTSVWIYVFITYSSQIVIALFACIAFIGSQFIYGGIDWVAIKAAADSRASRPRTLTERCTSSVGHTL